MALYAATSVAFGHKKEDLLFIVGNTYKRKEISKQIGGGTVTYLPTKSGIVVAACLTPEKNPEVPNVILCGTGERIAAAGELLADQRPAIPVFIKRDPNRWEYVGIYRPVASYTSGPDFERAIAASGRDRSDVSRVIVMMPVA